ncbi:MAG: hypothetical protein H0W72_10175 [Planctomycetes bacterium]|nr:hypothetical protein [Planctomycetota bacterium]
MTTTAAPLTGTFEIKGATLDRGRVLNVETKPAESWVRNGYFFFWGCLCPIAAMAVFACLNGPIMWGLGLVFAAGPFIALATAAAWKKPWGVVVEEPEAYRCIYMTSDKADADAVTAQVRAALA